MTYRRTSTLLAAFVSFFLFLAPPAHAVEVTITWESPTGGTTPWTNVDGSLADDLSHCEIECEGTQSGTHAATADCLQYEATVEWPLVPGETLTCYARAVDTAGNTSPLSDPASIVVPAAAPSPPSNLTADPSDLTAYGISQSRDRLVLYPVGTVATGTPCDETMSANGRYRVPVDSVTYAGTVRPPVVFAQCVISGP